MKTIPQNKGPWTHRAMVTTFTLLFGVLFYWLLGFVVKDIGTWPGPDRQEIRRELLDPELLTSLDQLTVQIGETTRGIEDSRARQKRLRDSTDNSEVTMARLSELQRLSLEKAVTPSKAEQEALAESQQLFLANQRRYQEISETVAQLSEQLRDQQERQRELKQTLQRESQPVEEEYGRRRSRHQFKLAAFKLAVLIPLLAAVVHLFLKHRSTLYGPLIYALGLATVAKVLQVMHEHFPPKYFKYLLIVAALVLVARVLVYLLRMVAHPKPDWLLEQYREAYERFLCPRCNFPIRRGPLKYAFWNRRTIKKLSLRTNPLSTEDKPYVCPACSTRLFEKCPSCQQIRHSLLPACSACGAENHPRTAHRTRGRSSRGARAS